MRQPGTRVLLATQAENRFEFVDVASPPVPSLLRGFSAPVKLSGLTPDRLRFLAAHDTDPFVRWESGQQFAATVLLDMIAAIQARRRTGGGPGADRGDGGSAGAGTRRSPPRRWRCRARRPSPTRWTSSMSMRSTPCAIWPGPRSVRPSATGCAHLMTV